MKKAYITPTTEILYMDLENLLAGSPSDDAITPDGDPKGETPPPGGNTSDTFSKDNNGLWDDWN